MKRKALWAAVPYTVPVMLGYLFLGAAFGVLIAENGFSVLWAFLMSTFIYAGSMQFAAISLMTSAFSPVSAFLLTLMVNARHLFYGLSMLKPFERMGKRKPYMIFSLTDETYSLFFITKVPEGVDEHKFLFSIALLDQLYWIIGSAIGALLGSVLPIDTTGIDFAMTALFVVIMVEQWMESKNRPSVLIGLGCGLVCLLIFGADNFILPTMICIMLILLPCRKFLDKETEQKKEVEHHAG